MFSRGGLTWQLDLKEGIDLSIFLLGGFERNAIAAYRRIIKPGNVVVDAGANIGAHTLPLAQLVGNDGRVLAFEPTAFAVSKFRANVAVNPELGRRITLHQVMLVSQDADALESLIYSSWPLTASSELHGTHKGRLMGTEGARAVTLDSMVRLDGCPRVDFIKLDVDGHEVAVLRGARITLERFRPIIALELAPYVHDEFGQRFEELIDLLRAHGYAFHHLTDDSILPANAAALRKLVPRKGGLCVLARGNHTRA